jgi:hypothetical protein
MDTVSSIILWIGIIILFLGALSPFLYFRRVFDPQGGKRALKTSTILLSIGALFMIISIYAMGVINLKIAIIWSVVCILIVVINYFIHLFFSNVVGKMTRPDFLKIPEDDELAPIDKLINAIKKVFIGKQDGREGGHN